MLVGSWLRQSELELKKAGIGTARLDALVLLEDVVGKDRAWLLAHPEFELGSAQLAKLKNLLNRRMGHEPLAYVRGKTEFYGREFLLTPDVLEPRPESETMIDLLTKTVSSDPQLTSKPPKMSLADVGTGSGALGITAKLELPGCSVDLLDIDEKALDVAKANVEKFTLNISVVASDLLASTHQAYDILLCNLPYVPDDYQINQAAANEPGLAIFGGPDGLDVYRRLFSQIQGRQNQPLYILCESLPFQHQELQSIATAAGYTLKATQDFIQLFGLD